jgi:hypothetical protein
MDVLIILGIGALIRLLRQRRVSPINEPPHAPTLTPTMALAPADTPGAQRTSNLKRLVRRAVCGMLLALSLVVFALLPWPTAWAVSAAAAPDVHHVQAFVLRNVDAVTIGAVVFALLEPLLIGAICLLLSSLFAAPHLVWQIARLLGVTIALGYWCIRRRLARWRWQQCCIHLITPTSSRSIEPVHEADVTPFSGL